MDAAVVSEVGQVPARSNKRFKGMIFSKIQHHLTHYKKYRHWRWQAKRRLAGCEQEKSEQVVQEPENAEPLAKLGDALTVTALTGKMSYYRQLQGSVSSLLSSVSQLTTSTRAPECDFTEQFITLLVNTYHEMCLDATVTPFDKTNPPSAFLNKVARAAVERSEQQSIAIGRPRDKWLLTCTRKRLLQEIKRETEDVPQGSVRSVACSMNHGTLQRDLGSAFAEEGDFFYWDPDFELFQGITANLLTDTGDISGKNSPMSFGSGAEKSNESTSEDKNNSKISGFGSSMGKGETSSISETGSNQTHPRQPAASPTSELDNCPGKLQNKIEHHTNRSVSCPISPVSYVTSRTCSNCALSIAAPFMVPSNPPRPLPRDPIKALPDFTATLQESMRACDALASKLDVLGESFLATGPNPVC
ncbi:AGL012Cp [Eremothecium gossypii ATCC 10895]|uniref:AGL012Cp n=1 Tax=Eremothecium gossypii (strain ATCC 10895 / CBS 109.51 / FGSC 9923 / NRRL Y-1056) TaxID=284811 RepID=Q750G5_EREGS|nr:AGL012Cp [Eremothecium gossypii ATCC 10895]AAS54478.1 AGL012Cp [Eremothecium gossypii ATCC 10895]AEY98810.1 FAGL012Cp [Eremothecium gossypii FDAG1]